MNGELKYKLIVCDFDGTLCRTDNTVSERNRKAIEKFFERGGIFTLSSGRNTVSIRHNLAAAGLEGRDIPLLGLQGSVIEENLSGRVLRELHLKKENALWFARECEKRGAYYHVYTRDKIFGPRACFYSDYYTRMTGSPIEYVGDVYKFISESGRDDFVKIFAVAENGMNTRYAEELDKAAPLGAHVFTSGPVFFECINSESGKGSGLKSIAELTGIDVSETAAFGDEMNDLSMIEAAGLGVAMANGRKELKDAADVIAPSNDDDGVAEIIEKYCL